MRENRFGVKLERGGRRADASRSKSGCFETSPLPPMTGEIVSHTLTLSNRVIGLSLPKGWVGGKSFAIFPAK